MQTGVEVFLEGLHGLGYKPITLPDNPNHVVIDYKVESGKLAGTKLRLGFVVPADFPMTPPTGPHVSPRIHPTHPHERPRPSAGRRARLTISDLHQKCGLRVAILVAAAGWLGR
jgi:hypothetical protein